MPHKGDKGDKSAARPPEGSLVETRSLIKGSKSAIVPFAEPRSGPKSKTGSGASQKAKSRERALVLEAAISVSCFYSTGQTRPCTLWISRYVASITFTVLDMTLNCSWWWGSCSGVWRMWSNPSLPLHPDPLWPGAVVPVWVYCIGQKKNCLIINKG